MTRTNEAAQEKATPEIPQEAREVIERAAPVIKTAEEHPVTNPDEYRAVAEIIRNGKAIRAELHKTMRSLLEPIEESERRIRALFQPRIDAWDTAERALKRRLEDYDREEERKRREEEERLQREEAERRARIQRAAEERARKAREAAEEKARKEREAAEERARKEREEAERRAQEARDREEAERIRREAEERAERERRAAEERAQRELEKAEARAEAALMRAETVASAPLPTVAREQVKVEGLARRKTWEPVDADLDQVIAAAAAGNVQARRLLTIDRKAFELAAKALGEDLPKIVPGVRVREKRTLAIGAAKR